MKRGHLDLRSMTYLVYCVSADIPEMRRYGIVTAAGDFLFCGRRWRSLPIFGIGQALDCPVAKVWLLQITDTGYRQPGRRKTEYEYRFSGVRKSMPADTGEKQCTM